MDQECNQNEALPCSPTPEYSPDKSEHTKEQDVGGESCSSPIPHRLPLRQSAQIRQRLTV